MNIKLKIGIWLENGINNLIKYNHKLIPFVPNGRIFLLDLKRAGIYPKKIFDVGANVGQTANFYNEYFPEADIYCFEPVKATYQELLLNVKNKNIQPYNEGLGSTIEEQTIHKNDSNESSSLKGNDGRFSELETVKINTGENFCYQNQIKDIDLLKIDTEGYELEVLKGFGPMLKSNIKMIYAEVGFDKNDSYKTYISDLLEFTNDKGFIVSGFYEPYRWGNGRFKFFCNVLLINTTLVEL